MVQDLRLMMIRGVIIGGLVGGVAGGLTAAVNVYLGHFDPDIYPYRDVFTVSIFFLGGFALAFIPGIVLGLLVSLAVFYFYRPRRADGNVDTIQSSTTWPPAPTPRTEASHNSTSEGVENYLLSESALAKDWLRPEEDEAWKCL